ncbi:hypothetical protein GA0115237_11085 [Streptomyces sp. ScaeMP-6W]|nr:hypothetical protein GA0115237_11085 [Streptomyces sp. ScaeMP-6W]
MTWSTLAATAVRTALGVLATLLATFSNYLTALSTARDTFTRAEPAPEHVGKGHMAISELSAYAAGCKRTCRRTELRGASARPTRSAPIEGMRKSLRRR